jgi:hypothetical protein
MSTVEEIARGLSQVLADSYDGAQDEDGNPLDGGLKRGVFDAKLTDKRVNDGYGLSLNGNVLVVNYQGEVSLKEIQDKNFESDVGQTLADVLKFIKKHFKTVTGNTLKCKPVGEINISVQSTSRVHTWVEAQMRYEIQGMDGIDMKNPTGEELCDQSIKDWLSLGNKSKKSQNDTRKKENSQ